MSVPSPPVALVQGGCAAIWDNTLYALQPGAFQSLPLKPGAKWEKLSLGVDVMFPSCVVGNQGGQPVMFVVGGRTGTKDYGGLQRYGFKDKKWQTIKFNAQSILSNRIGHGAAWLNDTQNIVVYAGYQDDSGNPSQQTFTVSTGEPPVVQSYTALQPPAVMGPTMTPWDNSHALMAGGSDSNQQVWTFGIAEGWKQVKVTLPKGTPSMMGLQASLIQGTNGSRILEVYDMSKVPCSVTGLLLATGAEKNNKRVDKQVEPTDKPVYNETWAPKTTLQGYTLAQSSDGLVVMVGGHSDRDADSIAMFNQTSNAWVNGGNFFSGKQVDIAATSAASTSSSTSLPTAAASTPAAPPPTGSMGQSDFTRMILAAVLGSIFGAIALAIIFLLFLRCLRRRSDKKAESQRLAEKMQRQGTFKGPSGGNDYHNGFGGGFSQRELTSPIDRTPTPDAGAVLNCPVHNRSPPQPEQQQQRARPDMGWSQYFSSDSHKEVGTRPNYNDTSDTARLTAYTEQSEYTSDTHTSAEVPPLDIHTAAPPEHDRDTFYNSTASQPEGWDPTAHSDSMPRAPSSVYEGDGQYGGAQYGGTRRSGPHPGDRVVIPSFPGVPASRTASIVEPNGDSDRGMRSTVSRELSNIPETQGLSSNPPPQRRSSKYVDDMSWLSLRRQ